MAVTKMKKLSLLGLKSEKDSILRDIAYTGSVEFTDLTARLSDEHWSWIVSSDSPGDDVGELEEKLSTLKTAIEVLTPFASKKGLFSSRPQKSREEFDASIDKGEGALDVARLVCHILKDSADTEGKINSLRQKITALSPWASLDVPLSLGSTASSKIIYGIFSAFEKLELIEQELNEQAEEVSVQLIYSDKQNSYVQLIFLKTVEDALSDVLKQHSFIQFGTEGDGEAPPAALIKKYEDEVISLTKQLEAQHDQVVSNAVALPELHLLYDALAGVLETKKARARLLVTGETFLIEGYVPAKLCSHLDSILSKYTVHLEYAEPTDADDTPILLNNSSIVQPYEMVTSMYSLPQYGQLDPNGVVAPFFCVFFGLMFSDAGYGLVLFLLGLFLSKKMKLTGTIKRMVGLMIQGGISTIFAGIIFGSYFGDAIPVVSKVFFGKTLQPPILFDPIAHPMEMLYACVAIGAIHVIVGMGVQGYQLIKEGNVLDAIFDVGFWYVVFAGIITFIIAGNVGLYVSAAGAVGLVLTQGRSKKGIFSKFFSGLLSLYGITGYMSDLLSYSRIMALGLSTGVIAGVFNKIGALGGGSVVGAILFVAVFIVGQLFNLAMGALGAYVHSSRLMYVEFFGKFYRSGGREFSPLKFKNRYVALKSIVDEKE